MLLVLLLLVGVNVYFLGFRGGTSIGALMRTTRVRATTPISAGATARPAPKTPPLPEDPVAARFTEGELADGQTVAQALIPRLGKRAAVQIEAALGEKLDLAALRGGLPYVLVHDGDDRLVAFELRVSPTLLLRVELAQHRARATTVEGRAEVRTVEVSVPTGAAMWDALRRAGEGAALGERLCELFAGEGDACAQGGERLRAVVEKRLIGGRLQRYGRILGAEWVTRVGVRRAFQFGPAGQYYTERGESLERRYRMSPFRASRGFLAGRRQLDHLPDGRVQVEYAAPSTAGAAVVCAVGTGTVTAITRAPAGASVTLKVAEGERITYTHLARLGRALALGQTVERGQAIGRADGGLGVLYEGETAARAAEAPSARGLPLAAADRPRFGETIAPVLERLRAVALRPTDPLASRGLSAIP